MFSFEIPFLATESEFGQQQVELHEQEERDLDKEIENDPNVKELVSELKKLTIEAEETSGEEGVEFTVGPEEFDPVTLSDIRDNLVVLTDPDNINIFQAWLKRRTKKELIKLKILVGILFGTVSLGLVIYDLINIAMVKADEQVKQK